MSANSALLAQFSPADTSINLLFQANVRTEVKAIYVTNLTGAVATFSLYHDDKGTAWGNATVLFLDKSVQNGDTLIIEPNTEDSGISVDIGGTIAVSTAAADSFNFSLYGITQDTQGSDTARIRAR